MPPKVFINRSSTSNIPTLNTSCNSSIVRLNCRVLNVILISFLLSGLIIGSKKPNGVNASMLPNMLTIKLSIPIILRY